MGETKDFLLEIGTEEMPSAPLLKAVTQYKKLIVSGLDEAGLAHGEARIISTPRRLSAYVKDVALATEEIKNGVNPLGIHGNTLKAISNLNRNGINFNASDLLEIGELSYLHAVEPDFPAKAPSAERWAFPVVLDKAHVMIFWIKSDGRKRAQVQVL